MSPPDVRMQMDSILLHLGYHGIANLFLSLLPSSSSAVWPLTETLHSPPSQNQIHVNTSFSLSATWKYSYLPLLLGENEITSGKRLAP